MTTVYVEVIVVTIFILSFVHDDMISTITREIFLQDY